MKGRIQSQHCSQALVHLSDNNRTLNLAFHEIGASNPPTAVGPTAATAFLGRVCGSLLLQVVCKESVFFFSVVVATGRL